MIALWGMSSRETAWVHELQNRTHGMDLQVVAPPTMAEHREPLWLGIVMLPGFKPRLSGSSSAACDSNRVGNPAAWAMLQSLHTACIALAFASNVKIEV